MTEYFNASPVKGRYQQAIAKDTAEALKLFCSQEPEFEQAILQSGKTFQECLDAVINGVSGSMSDLKTYQKAVEFYFTGAKVHFQMSIDLIGNAAEKKPEITMSRKSELSVSLDDLLDF